jgi:UDP-glucose 4-epimerase
MRILITGGFGFVGGRLAEHLARVGHQIILGTRHCIGTPDWLPLAKVVQISWNDATALEHICQGVDVIISAAGMNAQDCTADPVAALAFNGLATARMVAAAHRAGVNMFIYLSTAHVYASSLVGTITEKICPRNLHPYATSHLAGEYAVLSASQRGEIRGIVLRLSNTFGAPMNRNVNCWKLLVNDLCKQAVQTRKLVMQTNGLQHRDFIDLTAVCQVIERLSIIRANSSQANIFNVGAGVSRSVLEMAELIQQRCTSVLGFHPELQRTDQGKDEQNPIFNYKTDNLVSLDIHSNRLNDSAEIDDLLRFCQSAFAVKN